MMRRFVSSLVALFVFSILVTSSAWGYTYMKGNPRWSFSKMPVPWYVTYTPQANWYGRPLPKITEMVNTAFNNWEGIDCSFMMFRYMGTTKVGGVVGDGKNVIEWTPQLPGDSPASATGKAGPSSISKGLIGEGNVWIKHLVRADNAIISTLTHELGHAMGFGHSEVRGATMYFQYTKDRSIKKDDIDAICNAYPMASNTCAESSQCPTGLVCNGGRCIKCKTDTHCNNGNYCDRGLCTPSCKSDDDCVPKGRLCVDKKCTTCKQDADCRSGFFCAEDLCKEKCKVDSDCDASSECRDTGRCVKRGGCQNNSECKDTEYCQGQTCVNKGSLGKPCEGEADCADGQNCLIHDCKIDLDCNPGYLCDPEKKSCHLNGNKEERASICSVLCKDKDKETPCPSGYVCKEFGPDRSYCYPETRKPDPVKPPPPTTKDPDTKGCACSSQSTPSDLSLWTLLLFATTLLFRRKKYTHLPL